jgi:hypothetical protein
MEFDTQIWLYGTLVEVTVEYEQIDEGVEIEKATVIGVYHKGDNPRLRDYTALNTDIYLWGSEMTPGLYDELVCKAEEHIDALRWEGDRDEA